jgi:predicted transcriptional regulator
VAVLEAIAEDPRSRQQLRDKLSVSRTTLARILNEFEEREWIPRQGTEYTTTRTAEAILAKFDPLLQTSGGSRTW